MAAAVCWIGCQLAQRLVAQRLEKLVLELARTLVRAENFCLHFLQLRGDETLAAHGRLFAHVMRGHAGEIRFRDLDEIAEDRVETHLERLDPGGRDLALLQLADPFFSVARSRRSSSRRHRIHREKFRLPSARMADHPPALASSFCASSGISWSSFCRRCASSDSDFGLSHLPQTGAPDQSESVEQILQFALSAAGICCSEVLKATRSRALPEAWLKRPTARSMSRIDFMNGAMTASRSGSCNKSAIICCRRSSSVRSRNGCKIHAAQFAPAHRRDRSIQRGEQARVPRAARFDQFEIGLRSGIEHDIVLPAHRSATT